MGNLVNPYRFDSGIFSFPMISYVRSWEGVNVDGSGDCTSLDDLSGNGNDWLARGTSNPEVVGSGINGVQSLRFDGANGMYCDTMTFPINNDKMVAWVVYQLEAIVGVTYHAIFLSGTSYTIAGNFIQFYNTGSGSTAMRINRPTGSDFSFTGVQLDPNYLLVKCEGNGNNISGALNGAAYTVKTQNNLVTTSYMSVGQWNGRGAKMLFSECGIIEDPADFGASEKTELETYLSNTYGI